LWNSSKYACTIGRNTKDIPTYSYTNKFQVYNPVSMLINADCMQTLDCSQFCLQIYEYIFLYIFFWPCIFV